MTLEDFLARLDGVKPHKGYHMALCPGHDDAKGSLSVRVMDGWIRPHCFAGCTRDVILAALGLEIRDLRVGGDDNGHGPPPEKARGKSRVIEWITEAMYDYTDEVGELEFQVVRRKPADGSPDKKIHQRRPVPGFPGQWALGLGRGWYQKGRDDSWRKHESKNGPDVPPGGPEPTVYLDEQRPLIYRLGDHWKGKFWRPAPWPTVQTKKWIVIAEGEKKVEDLASRGIPATTNAQGAGKWVDAHTVHLVTLGVKVAVLFPDHDPPGARHMETVLASLLKHRIECVWMDAP